MKNKKQSGFTLVELSIVIIIIGLTISGVITANSLVKQAKLKSVMSDVERYSTAVNSFKLAYNALPGDMTDASEYWPVACTDNGANTCNGNGNRQIEFLFESSRSFQHLGLAGLIPDQLRGNDNSGKQTVGIDIPATAINGGGLSLQYNIADAGLLNVAPAHMILFGTEGVSDPINPVITPRDAFRIDEKRDDGKPNQGIIHVRANDGNCHTGSGATMTYLVSNDSIACAVYFDLTV